jgi:hypothetical protein
LGDKIIHDIIIPATSNMILAKRRLAIAGANNPYNMIAIKSAIILVLANEKYNPLK